MNMISTGTFLEEMDTSSKHEALVKKLVGAWEKKNSKIARAGGVSLMALTLAACGDDDDTPFSQADVDAAKATAKAEGVAEGVASVDITSDNAAVAEAARAEGVASVDITSDNAAVIASAVATAEAAKDAEIATLQASYDALVATNATLQASYDALVAPKSLAATTSTDTLQGGGGNDAFTAAAGTVAAADRFNDSSTTDSDTLTITHSTAPGAFTAINIENIDITLNNLGALAVDAANISGATALTVTRGDVVVGGATLTGNKAVQVDNVDASAIGSITVGAGTTTVDINQAAADLAGIVLNADTATGAITVDGAATINAANSTSVTITAPVNTDAAEIAKATVINAAKAATVVTDAGLTGSITVNAALATDVDVLDAQGGATVTAATGAITADSVIDIRDIDASGATVTVGTGADDATTAGNIAIDLLLDGTAGTTDTATVSGAGHIELDIDGNTGQLVEILTLSGNGADVIYDLTGGNPTSITKAGSNSVEVMAAASALTTKTITGVDIVDVISGANTAIDGSLFTGVGKIDLGVDAQNQALTWNSGQTIELTADQTTGTNLDFSAAGGGDLTIVAGDDNGASSAVGTITLAALNAAAAATTVGTVTIEASVANVTATGTTLGAKQNLVITGDEDVTLGTVVADSVSAVNSTGVIDMTAANGVDVVSLGSGADVLVVNDATGDATGNGHTVDMGAGNDTLTITDTADASTFNAGAGNDTINVDQTSNIVVLGGAGNDNFATAIAAAGTIIGGDGTDTITIDADAAVTFGATFAFSGISELDITAVSNKVVSMTGAQLANNSTLILDGNAADDVFNVNTASTATAAKSADLSNVTVKTGATVGITVTGNVGVDTITGGVASETFTQTLSADSIEGGGTTNADTYVAVSALAPGGGSANSVGSVVNLGSTAVSSAAITSATSSYIAGSLTEVGAGKVAYMYSANATANSTDVDTVGGIENVTGSAGIDYIVGTTGNNTLTGEAGADYIDGGAGADTITGGLAADTILLGASDAVSDTVVFTSGLTQDAVSNFETGIDKATFDISELETNGAVIAGNTHNLIDGDGTDITDASTGVILAVAGATTLTQTATILNYTAATVANAAALETALEAGGGLLTTEGTTGVTANDSMLAMYDNGTNIMLAIVEFTATVANNTKIAAVDVADIASLTGITADLAAGDFAFIA